jgi:hypothetical protein
MSAPDLTPAERDMLRSLPQRIAAQPIPTGKGQNAAVARRRRLQNWGLLSVRHDAAAGCFVVTITDAGVGVLKAKPGGGGR